MSDSSPSRLVFWRSRWGKITSFVRRSAPFAAGVLVTFSALWLYSVLFPGPHQITPDEVSTAIVNAMDAATPRPAFSAEVYRVIQPSLVLIETRAGADPHEGRLGSGVVIDDKGDILTSLHVVANAEEIRVTFADGFETTAHIIDAQPDHDIAVLRADEPPQLIAPAILGNPNSMRIGDEVYAVGNPFGLYGSMSAGVISGFDRTFKPEETGFELQGLIQVDAAINPGNSGGPLLNRDGQVIAIVTGIVNPTGQRVFVGIGFAVPITVAVSGLGSPPY